MTRLLYVQGSPRGERSRSTAIADSYLEGLKARDPSLMVEPFNVWQADLPRFDGDIIEGRYALLNGQPVDPDIRQAWADIQACADHFLSFDRYVIATPMWNYGLPYRLKQYIDVLTQPGMMFRFSPEAGLVGALAGRKACVVCSSALTYTDVDGTTAVEFQMRYLKVWLDFVGLTDVQWLRVAPMFGPPELVEPAMAAAHADAKAAALVG